MTKRSPVAVFVILLIAALVVFYVLVLQGRKKAQIELQTQFQNPFDKDSQYVNPFSKYKNPFDQL